MEIPELYKIFMQHPSVQTDTRKLQKGDLFFALKGPNFNANTFAIKALQLGAAYAVIDENIDESNPRLIVVADTLLTLQALAKYHRQQLNIPFIAITGSNGKTTTKELVSAVLAAHYTTYTTKGNLNNHIGVPLSILSVQNDAEFAVIEMGANHQQEIASYCTYTLPTYGIITNCGKAHLEGFGGVEGVRKGKGELYDFLRTNNGTAFVYWDYDYLQTMCNGIKAIIKYGTESGKTTGYVVENEPFLQVTTTVGISTFTINSQLVGSYNLPNVLCAVAVGSYFKVPLPKIKEAIEAYKPSNSRSQLLNTNGNTIILDAYNANPTSMKAAIENFIALAANNKVLVLGAMMELGSESIAEHETIIKLIENNKWLKVVLVGGDFEKVAHSYIYFNTSDEAKIWFQQQHFQMAHILVKGSRSMKMEKVLESE